MRCEFPWHGMDDHTPCALWPGPDSKVARVTETKASRGPAEVRAHFRKCSGSLKTMGVHIYIYIHIYTYIYIHTHTCIICMVFWLFVVGWTSYKDGCIPTIMIYALISGLVGWLPRCACFEKHALLVHGLVQWRHRYVPRQLAGEIYSMCTSSAKIAEGFFTKVLA